MLLMLSFLFLIVIGFPIAMAIGIVVMGYDIIWREFPLTMIPYKMFDIMDNFCLIAVPIFILGGVLVTKIGITEKLIVISNQMVGRITGGMSHVNVLVSTLFGGLNGSAVGDAAAVGSILIKPMKKMGFSSGYSAAVTAASGTISAIIPPSIPFIVYASVVSEVSIGALFIGGIVPGVMICVAQCFAGYFVSVHRKYPKITEPFVLRQFIKDLLLATPALILVAIIIFGLRSGVFTPTEVASVIVVYAMVLGFVVYRNLTLKTLFEALYEAALTTGMIFLIIACAAPFMWIITKIGITESICSTLLGLSDNGFIWWTIVAAFLLVVGMIMDITANLLILGPIVFTAAKGLGFDPLVSSIVIVLLLLMGIATPPVGIALYATCAIAEEGIEKASIEVIPFILAEVCVVALILVFPELVKFLPRVFGYVV